MINNFIDEIREKSDFLYEKYDLFIQCIVVSEFFYIQLQRDLFQLIEKNICDFKFKEPLQIDNIPVVINNDLNDGDYKIVVSIPSYKFKDKEV